MGSRLAIAYSPFTRRIETRVLRYVRARDVFGDGESVVVGVSGGPDSTALLLILARLRDELGLRITAAHFDHRLRTREEAAGDRAFVEGLSKALGVPFVAGSGDVAARARRERESIEEAARVMRYRFLGREARRANATVVAVGHTLDDRAETVLLHVIRGSGLDGLAAMPPRAPWPFGPGPDVARPLLELARPDTERYCRESGTEPRHDPTNDLPIATRNRLRQELMPVLRRFNPRVAKSLARLADAAARDAAFLNAEADALWEFVASTDGDGFAFDREALEGLHPAVVARLLRRAAARASGGPTEVGAEHIERVVESLLKRRSRTSLPGGLVAVTDESVIAIYPGAPPEPRRIREATLAVPGTTRAGEWTIEAEVGPVAQRKKPGEDEALLDAGAIKGALAVRSRRAGDRLWPLGLGGTKKVQDILVDAKAPAEERDGVPIVEDERGIVWVAGHCIDERVKVGPRTRRVLRLRAKRQHR